MYQAFYRKWRPQVFDDVCGQEHITSILKYETEHEKFSHAYLFCGSRGTGKTTCAKILAKAVNCLEPINGNPCNCCASCRAIDEGIATDVLEMDAASNNGVDNIRDIRDEVVYTPSALKYRVYIVDEVHMLSGSAFNALLKTLEEPPAHAIFVLATTELHKLPSTIVSRCQRYDFRRISTDALMGRLAYIADKEGLEYTDGALRIIAKMAQGGMRDAISLLELCAGNRELISEDVVNNTLGVGGRASSEKLVKAIAESDFDGVFAMVDAVVSSSKDLAVFWQDLISYYRDMLVIKTTREAKKYLDLTDDETKQISNTAALFTKETLLYHSRILDETLFAMQKSGYAKRTVAEMSLLRMCDASLDNSADALAARISQLENMILSGNISLSVSDRRIDQKADVSDNKEESKQKKYDITVKEAALIDKKSGSNQEMPKKDGKAEESKVILGEVRAIRGWSEIVERSVSDVSIRAFLKMGRALYDGEKVQIRFGAIIPIIDTPRVKEALAGGLSVALRRKIEAKDIIYGLYQGNEDSCPELSELDFD